MKTCPEPVGVGSSQTTPPCPSNPPFARLLESWPRLLSKQGNFLTLNGIRNKLLLQYCHTALVHDLLVVTMASKVA